MALFAADAIAERLGATRPKRFWLAAASATALWSVTVRWGHPEDAVAIGLLLYAILALADARPARSAWLAGAADLTGRSAAPYNKLLGAVHITLFGQAGSGCRERSGYVVST